MNELSFSVRAATCKSQYIVVYIESDTEAGHIVYTYLHMPIGPRTLTRYSYEMRNMK